MSKWCAIRWIFLLLLSTLFAAEISEKVLICGIGRNVAKAAANTIQSATELGSHFADYRVIIYENNSSDNTKELFQAWAAKDPHVLFLSEKVSQKRLTRAMAMKVRNRTELIARARNIVLETAMQKRFDDYAYIIWADLDFLKPWDVESIVETILFPQEEWDAVFAYGAYDLFALRTPRFPIGFELVGQLYWDRLEEIRSTFVLDREAPWQKVYSAFGGIGIYKRDALRGCRYSGVVTRDLETVALQWLEAARRASDKICFLEEYETLLAHAPSFELSGPFFRGRDRYGENLGLRLPRGRLVWFSCTPHTTLPWTCEHIPLHAAMAIRGHNKLFLNPKIRSSP